MIDESRVTFTGYKDSLRQRCVLSIWRVSAWDVVIGFEFPIVIKAAKLCQLVDKGLKVYVLL